MILCDRLRRSITTASNDDLSKPMTLQRTRHVERVEAITDAVEAIEHPSARLRDAVIYAEQFDGSDQLRMWARETRKLLNEQVARPMGLATR
jgi:hypothetical protein